MLQHDYFSSFNQSYNSFGTLRSPLPSSVLSSSSPVSSQKSYIILLPPFHVSGLESSLSGLLQSVPWYPLGSPPLKSRLTSQEDTGPVRTGEPAQRKRRTFKTIPFTKRSPYCFVCSLQTVREPTDALV